MLSIPAISSLLSACTFVLLTLAIRRWWRSSDDVSSLPGPNANSWLYGNLGEFVLGLPAGKVESDWCTTYGLVYKFRACFGKDRLMIVDPVAIKHVLATPAVFSKSPSHQLINQVGFGTGSLLYAHGEDHRRIRAVMNPMFSGASVRALTPILVKKAQDLADEWSTLSGSVIDVYRSLHRTTLQAITEAVMGYDTTNDKAYVSCYEGLVHGAAQRSKAAIVVDAILSRFPPLLFKVLMNYPPPDLKQFLDHRLITGKIAEKLLQARLQTLRSGAEPENDLFSVLVKQNESAAAKMTHEELKQQFGTITTAGEDTTANSVVWVLYAISRHPKWQNAIRDETQTSSNRTGASMNYDQLPILNAVIKEVLRLYSTVASTERICTTDTVIPLSAPIVTSLGESLTELRVEKGRTIVVSISSYHRLPAVWGSDARVFNPERWLGKEDAASGALALGPYANLLTFLGGPRTCIGWRFALLETQIIVSELVKRFSFSLPDGVSIEPASAITLVPMDSDGQVQLPLLVKHI